MVPERLSPSPIGTNFVAATGGENSEDPILMLHGFDSSLLEFRRLLPKLKELGADAYAVDVLGWGFTDLSGVSSFGAGTITFPVHIPGTAAVRGREQWHWHENKILRLLSPYVTRVPLPISHPKYSYKQSLIFPTWHMDDLSRAAYSSQLCREVLCI